MIKPTVGRIVLYRPAGVNDRALARNGGEPLAAMVVCVHGDSCVNLVVFDATGCAWPKLSVRLVQPHEPIENDTPHCHWMDYQLGQAAKVEALERDADRAARQVTGAAPAA